MAAMEEKQRYGVGIWELKERFKERFRERLRLPPRHPFHSHYHKQSQRVSTKAAVATSLAAARVFKGNAVLARLAGAIVRGHWSSSKKSGERWRARATIQLSKPPFKVMGPLGSTRSVSGSQPALAASEGKASLAAMDRRGVPVAGVSLGARDAPRRAPMNDGSQSRIVQSAITSPGMVKGSLIPAVTATGSHVEEVKAVVRSYHPGHETAEEQRNSVTVEVDADSLADTSLLMKTAQALAVPIFGSMSRIFMHGLNQTEVFESQKLTDAIWKRPKGQPLITVCNHVGSMDDPLVLAALVPSDLLVHASAMRWTLCATDRCFTNPVLSAFFRTAKVLPIVRGAGLQHKGVDVAISKLNRGDWVHMFPEGSRSRDGGKTIGSIKRGIGRLVLDPKETPMLIPFIHKGMEDVIPVGQKLPAVGKRVAVLVGDPIPLDDLIDAYRSGLSTPAEVYKAVAVRVGRRMHELKGELDVRLEHAAALKEMEAMAAASGWREVRESWEILDWQAQGMGLWESISGNPDSPQLPFLYQEQTESRNASRSREEEGPSTLDKNFERSSAEFNTATKSDSRPRTAEASSLTSTSATSDYSKSLRTAERIVPKKESVDGIRRIEEREEGGGLERKAAVGELRSTERESGNPWRELTEFQSQEDEKASLRVGGGADREDDGRLMYGRDSIEDGERGGYGGQDEFFDGGDGFYDDEIYEDGGARWGRWSSSSTSPMGWDLMMGFAARGLFGREREKGAWMKGLNVPGQSPSERTTDMDGGRPKLLDYREEKEKEGEGEGGGGGKRNEEEKQLARRDRTRPNWRPLLEKAGGIYQDFREQKGLKERRWRLIDFFRSDPKLGSLGLVGSFKSAAATIGSSPPPPKYI